MTADDIREMLAQVPQELDDRYRALASLFIEGEILGPFLYSGTRADDPNDIVPHRRDLRSLYVFAAWLDHHDATALNTLDTVVEENRTRYIKHYLIDFGSILGSSARGRRSARDGHAYQFDFLAGGVQLATLGLRAPPWQRVTYPDLPEVGRFEPAAFDPRDWKAIYPNPAFVRRRPDDTYWAVKKVMAFSDEQIRAIVATGEYDDPAAADYVAKTLIERRDKIGRAFFHDVLPLDSFEIRAHRLYLEDLAWSPTRSS